MAWAWWAWQSGTKRDGGTGKTPGQECREEKNPQHIPGCACASGEERGQKARDCQEFSGEKERTGLLRGMRAPRRKH